MSRSISVLSRKRGMYWVVWFFVCDCGIHFCFFCRAFVGMFDVSWLGICGVCFSSTYFSYFSLLFIRSAVFA